MKKVLTFCLLISLILGLGISSAFASPLPEKRDVESEECNECMLAVEQMKADALAELAEAEEYEDLFAEWNGDSPALSALVEYVEAVTDETSEDYIPPADRIAVFDMDGTLYGELFPTYLEYYMLAWRILEDPSFTPDYEMLCLGRELRESVISHSFADDMPIRHAQQAARAYAGMTLQEFSDFVTQFLVRDVDGFEGMTYGTAFYLPMIEVVEYLQDNDFIVYVCSGTDRFICRTLLEGMLDIPYENIIGMDVALEASGQNGEDGLDYVFSAGDDVVRTDRLLIKNLKMNKVLQIVQEIGRQPVLSFGNSSGDISMHMYTVTNNVYRSAAFMLIADDEERDYGNAEKGVQLRERWEENGFQVISMHDDFRTIYGDDVVKTGSFRWAEEMAEERVPAVSVDYGESKLYSREEMDAAIALIEEEFSTWEGCELHYLRYASDEFCCEENIAWLNDISGGRNYTQCIEFKSDFHSPVEAYGAWEADQEYYGLMWDLARTEDGAWELVTWGY